MHDEHSKLADRSAGSLLGLAIGDALGAAVEFKPAGTFPPVTGYRDGGPHGLAAGEWTDDTSMALALADSLPIPACRPIVSPRPLPPAPT